MGMLLWEHKNVPNWQITIIYSAPFYQYYKEEFKLGEACLDCGSTQSINNRLSSRMPNHVDIQSKKDINGNSYALIKVGKARAFRVNLSDLNFDSPWGFKSPPTYPQQIKSIRKHIAKHGTKRQKELIASI